MRTRREEPPNKESHRMTLIGAKSNSRLGRFTAASALLLPPGPEELHPPLDALQAALACERPAEPVRGRLAYVLAHEHAARVRDRGDAAREVHRSPVPVARASKRRAARQSGPERRKSLALRLRALDEVEGRPEHRVDVVRDEHRRFADHLHDANRCFGDNDTETTE